MIVAGTGHRPDKLGGYSEEALFKLQGIAIDWLIDNKPTQIISGMALGWDTALAMAACSLNIQLIAAIPFKGQELKWPALSQKRYNTLINMATIVYVCDAGYAAWKMQKRNEWMVNNCETVLAMWNGTEGGTANCIIYAQNVGRPIINLYDQYKSPCSY